MGHRINTRPLFPHSPYPRHADGRRKPITDPTEAMAMREAQKAELAKLQRQWRRAPLRGIAKLEFRIETLKLALEKSAWLEGAPSK